LYDIGKCSGPCVGKIDPAGYQELVASWARFFEGDVRELRDRLQTQMRRASEQQHYEAAAKARDGLAALERAAGAQSVVLDAHSNLDVIAIASEGSRSAIVRFRVRFGRIIGRTVHLVDRSLDEDDCEVLENALTDMYLDQESVPPVVVVERTELATTLVREYLSEVREKPIEVVAAKRGRRRRVVELAVHDAESVIARDSLRRQADHNVRSRALQELGAALHLEQPPYRIECFDMSHLQGTNYVGSMVVFEDGLPVKSDYRHFNVKEVLGNDDVGAMEEVVRRRLTHWEEHQSSSKFRRADLIIIDGGLPQLHAAEKAARTL
jgi:excinuclease ABC subunit C